MFVDTDFRFRLNIHHGVIEYITGSKYASKLWEIRGVTGHKKDGLGNLQKQIADEINTKMKLEENQIKLQDFLRETHGVFNGIINNNKKVLAQYIEGRKFYFVLGTTRTGGTYIQKELGKALDWPITDFLHDMTHDSIPRPEFIMGRDFLVGSNNMAWRKPFNYYNFTFHLAQLLVYLNRVAKGKRNIVIKHAYFCFCLPVVDEVFGEYADYIVTVRHPASTAASRAESRGIDPNHQEFRQMCFKEWQNSYTAIVSNGPPEGRITTLLFGEEMDIFLKHFFDQNNFSSEPDGVKITKRQYDYNFWNSSNVVRRIENIGNLWELYDLKFPVPKEIE